MAKAKKKEVSSDPMDDVLDELKKKYRVNDGSTHQRKDKISTGSLLLDDKLDGGFVRGKIIEIYGPESTGKSAMAFTLMSQGKGVMGYVDGESNWDKETAELYGVDTSRVIQGEPEYLEQGLEMVEDFVGKKLEIIVYDSIAGLAPKAEMEGSMEDHTVGKKAFRMNQHMRRIHLKANDAGSVIFFINQIRANVGANMYAPQTITPGGMALAFHASYRLQITGTEKIMQGETKIGHYIKITIKKNKFGPPDQKVEIPFLYGYGVSKEWELVDLALKAGIFVKAGSWIKYDDANLAQGQLNTVLFLKDNPDFFNEIKTKLHEKV